MFSKVLQLFLCAFVYWYGFIWVCVRVCTSHSLNLVSRFAAISMLFRTSLPGPWVCSNLRCLKPVLSFSGEAKALLRVRGLSRPLLIPPYLPLCIVPSPHKVKPQLWMQRRRKTTKTRLNGWRSAPCFRSTMGKGFVLVYGVWAGFGDFLTCRLYERDDKLCYITRSRSGFCAVQPKSPGP